jgi:20S proteasome subunit beta 1
LHSILLCCFHFHSRLLLSSSAAEANRSPDFSPSAFSYRHRHRQTNHNDHNNNDNNDNNKVNLGTTLVAIKYSGGVVVGADTRTSVGGYVSNKFAYKINPIFQPSDDCTYQFNDDERKSKTNPSSCVLCRSGSAADTQWLAKQAQRRFRVRRLERPGYHPSVSEVAHYLRYRMRDEGSNGGGDGLQASLICAGYDAATNGGQIFGITPGGSLWEEDNFCVSGSGSTILLGYLDDFLQTKTSFSSDLTRDEAIALVTKLLRLSIGRDGSSGGLVRLYVINEDGLEEKTVYPFMEGDGESTYSELEGFATPGRR